MDEAEKNFPKWETLYEDVKVETMPWFHPALDPDLERSLAELGIVCGSFLDIGTGPATQAIALAKMGFRVTATDISGAAIKRGRGLAKEMGLHIDFRRDDILATSLMGPFDFVFDRGCFHTLSPGYRDPYLRVVSRLVQGGGYLFLKCFSHEEPMEDGPYRFSPEEIRTIFSGTFDTGRIENTVYQGTLDPLPRALFCVLKKR
ncbi:MAG: methyltransferase domain-containing protein [Deltaproteobacteria bacterium]|nr:methyltransferase domain-containing protein [Deltaproteobacteria bacterium]NIS77647.1 methyltransferase domain-containing protein [Deltaproteobacteria bacterium]